MNLVTLSTTVRRIISVLLLLIGLYLIFLLLRPAVRSLVNVIFPPKNLPNPIYGKLDQLEFIEKPILGQVPIYRLETTNGKLPTDFPSNMVVWKVEDSTLSYTAGKDAQEDAEVLGFTDEELTSNLKGSIYSWKDLLTGSTLQIDINTKQITSGTPLGGNTELFPVGSATSAKIKATELLKGLNRLDDVLYSKGTQVMTLGKIQSGEIVEAQGPFETRLTRVDFFRDINEFQVLGPDPKKGLINVTVGAKQAELPILEYPFMEYTQWELMPDNEGTYPIITVAEAWNAVAQEGKGVVVNVTPLGKSVFSEHTSTRIDTVLINEIYLAYYDTPKRQDYLQPIYVFEGKYNVNNKPGGSVIVYFPAIAGQYVKTGE